MARVLIAEDDINVLVLYGTVVDSMGHACVSCTDSREALEFLEKNRDIALMIIDYKMPEMDGGQLVQRIRAMSAYVETPVLMVSSVIRARDIAHLLDRGVTWFMAKPVDIDELKHFITKHIPVPQEPEAL